MIEQNSQGAHPIENIVRNIKPADSHLKLESQSSVSRIDSWSKSLSLPKLSFTSLRAPAIFINNDLKILWQNKSAIEDIWHHTSIMRISSGPTSVFQLLFNANFQSMVKNWRPWTVFFLRHGICMSSRKHVGEVIDDQNERCVDELRLLMADLDHSQNNKTGDERIDQIQTRGTVITFQVTLVEFTEGRLLIFNEDFMASSAPSCSGISGAKGKIHTRKTAESIHNLLGPVEKPIYFISVRVANADTLQTSMLPLEYSRLLSLVWNKCVEIIERNAGWVVDAKADSLMGLFVAQDPMDAKALLTIQCALELKSGMDAIARQWKIRRGWLHPLELGVGIHFSDEFIGPIGTSEGKQQTTFGNGRQTAARLSSMAVNGEIWATKHLVNKLSPDELQRVHFGIFRDENQSRLLIEHGFERFGNLSTGEVSEDQAYLIVTRIFDCRP